MGFAVAGCADDAPATEDGNREAPDGVLSRARPGSRQPDEVRALEPKLVLVRGPETWLGRVEARPPQGVVVERLELIGPAGNVIEGVDLAPGAVPEFSFTLPFETTGSHTARVRYASGQTWVVETTL